jgi:SecY interacting protein Syd
VEVDMSKIELLNQAWEDFVGKWQVLAEQNGYPEIESDPQWPSECEFSLPENNEKTYWKPVKSQDDLAFDNVGLAMDLVVDEQYSALFSMYYADNLNAQHSNGPLQFLQAWSQSDFERLQQNLIGHLMMKAKLKQPPTLFFAVTDEDDLNLVVVNDSGEIWLEYVGKEPHKKVADNLAEFIAQSTPVLSPL